MCGGLVQNREHPMSACVKTTSPHVEPEQWAAELGLWLIDCHATIDPPAGRIPLRVDLTTPLELQRARIAVVCARVELGDDLDVEEIVAVCGQHCGLDPSHVRHYLVAEFAWDAGAFALAYSIADSQRSPLEHAG